MRTCGGGSYSKDSCTDEDSSAHTHIRFRYPGGVRNLTWSMTGGKTYSLMEERADQPHTKSLTLSFCRCPERLYPSEGEKGEELEFKVARSQLSSAAGPSHQRRLFFPVPSPESHAEGGSEREP